MCAIDNERGMFDICTNRTVTDSKIVSSSLSNDSEERKYRVVSSSLKVFPESYISTVNISRLSEIFYDTCPKQAWHDIWIIIDIGSKKTKLFSDVKFKAWHISL